MGERRKGIIPIFVPDISRHLPFPNLSLTKKKKEVEEKKKSPFSDSSKTGCYLIFFVPRFPFLFLNSRLPVAFPSSCTPSGPARGRSSSRSTWGGGGEKDHVRIATIKSDFALLLKYYSISPLFIWIVVNILESFFVKKKKKKEMHPYPCINNGRCHNSPPCSSSLRARPGLPVIPLNSLLLSSLTSPAPAV